MPIDLKNSLVGRNPLFRYFICATTISMLGGNLFDFAMPLHVYSKTHSVFAMSSVYFCLSLPHFLMAPFMGYSADQFNRRKILLVADSSQMALLLLLILNLFPVRWEITVSLIFVFLIKTMAILFETIITFQLIPSLVPRQDLSEANTWFLSAQRAVQILGPFIGGILMSGVGINGCIWGNILSFSATLFFSFKIKHLNELIQSDTPNNSQPLSFSHFFESFTDGLKFVWKSPVFRPFVYLMFFWNLCSLIPRTTSVTFFFSESSHYSPFAYGMVLSMVGLAEITAYVGGRSFYRQRAFPGVFMGSALWQAAMASIALLFATMAPSPLAFAIFLACSRMGSSILTMGTFLLRQTMIPRQRSGTVNSCIRMLFMCGAPLSSLAQGLIIHRWGVGLSMLLGGISLWAVGWQSRRVALALSDRDHFSRAA